MNNLLRSVVTGVGAYLPDTVVSNADLSKIVDTTDEWIVERTGIRQRHRAHETHDNERDRPPGRAAEQNDGSVGYGPNWRHRPLWFARGSRPHRTAPLKTAVPTKGSGLQHSGPDGGRGRYFVGPGGGAALRRPMG